MVKKTTMTEKQIIAVCEAAGYTMVPGIEGISMRFAHPRYGTTSHFSYASVEKWIRNLVRCNPGYFPEAEEMLAKVAKSSTRKKTITRTVAKKKVSVKKTKQAA